MGNNDNTGKLIPKQDSKASSSESNTVYVAKKGDTILTISKQFGITANTLRALNGLDPSNEEDKIEEGESYIIRVPGVKAVLYNDKTKSSPSTLKTKDSDPTPKNSKKVEAKKAGSSSSHEKCENSCAYANDGSCDDGGEEAEQDLTVRQTRLTADGDGATVAIKEDDINKEVKRWTLRTAHTSKKGGKCYGTVAVTWLQVKNGTDANLENLKIPPFHPRVHPYHFHPLSSKTEQSHLHQLCSPTIF